MSEVINQGVRHVGPDSYRKNKVHLNNRYTYMDFEPYEYHEYPKMIEVPVPLLSSGLPDEDALPVELRRKTREWEDDQGQTHHWQENDKNWGKRVLRCWPNFWPVAEDKTEELRLRSAAEKARKAVL